jgi:hypothetical protein
MVAPAGNRFSGWRPRQPPQAAPSLKQWARLYRAASRVPGMDLPRLQRLSQRLYQKPLGELSPLEAADLSGALKAAERGVINVQRLLEVLGER